MREQQLKWNEFVGICGSTKVLAVGLPSMLVVALLVVGSPAAVRAATTWDSQALGVVNMVPDQPLGNGTPWWFDPVNWSPTEPGEALPHFLPPTDDGTSLDEANIINSAGLPNGAVIYDPSSNDPNFANAGNLTYPTGYGPQTIWRLFMCNNPAGDPNPTDAKLIIRGDLTASNAVGTDTRWQIGRTSGTVGTVVTGTIIQEKGVVKNNFGDVDLGSIQTSISQTYGNGTYDYRSGTFEQGMTSGRLRLQAGGSTATGGVGTFIVHNPGTDTMNGGGGYVRVNEVLVASHGGQNGIEPNGTTTGVGIIEFHYKNGGTRAMQIVSNLTLNNGSDADGAGIRSSRLRLVLDEAPSVDMNGVPQDLGLFDVDSDGNGTGNIIGPGVGPGGFGLTFSNADAANPLAPSAVYDNLVDTTTVAGADNIVTAMFGSSTYRWRLHYNGDIRWAAGGGADNSVLDLTYGGGDGINGPGTGRDIVLIGLDSVIVPMGLPGDYNNDHVVDAADYTVWRDHLGAADESSLNGNGDGLNGVDIGDYNRWKAHFGETSGAGSLAAGAVPEPNVVMLGLLSLFGLVGLRRRVA